MPQPPGKPSNWRAGAGFHMSSSRNNTNAASHVFQLNVAAPASVIHCPITSSTTTICGSGLFVSFATTPADQIPGARRIAVSSSSVPRP